MSKFVDFTILEFAVEIELNQYEEHTTRIEAMINERIKQLHSKMKKGSSRLNGYEKAEYIENFKSDYEYDHVVYKLPDTQRKSELIGLYSLLERNLVKIAEMQEKKSDNPVKMTDLKDTGYIDKAKIYLEKVSQVDFPSDDGTWEEIKFIQELRNKCVHLNATIPTGNGKLISYIKRSEYLDLNSQYQLEITQGYTKYCICVFRKFFSNLFPRLKEKNMPKVELLKS
ncbi:hypothetical protein [Desulfobacula sp.]|uniref:hypothetical protein n=1 Tax=Desulfobacula sp. TaxID=2593537 RepID=UPI001ED3554A|nr:hypothetical protein [Desulfobacula sp.]